MSGIACTARLRPLMPGAQILILTVSADSDTIFRALEAGADGYLLKRTKPEDLRAALLDVLSGGAPMTSEIARMVVRSFRAPSSVPDADGLTARESQILVLIAEGLTNKEIAQKANISAGTVRVHLGHIFKKLHVRCRTEAAARYFRKK